jgi:hypothetical protein
VPDSVAESVGESDELVLPHADAETEKEPVLVTVAVAHAEPVAEPVCVTVAVAHAVSVADPVVDGVWEPQADELPLGEPDAVAPLLSDGDGDGDGLPGPHATRAARFFGVPLHSSP